MSPWGCDAVFTRAVNEGTDMVHVPRRVECLLPRFPKAAERLKATATEAAVLFILLVHNPFIPNKSFLEIQV